MMVLKQIWKLKPYGKKVVSEVLSLINKHNKKK
jgi:hypothetical protein